MSGPADVIAALARTTNVPAKAMRVAAASTRPSARMRRAHTTSIPANAPINIAIAPYRGLPVRIAVAAMRPAESNAPAVSTSSVRRTWPRWVASSGLTGARLTWTSVLGGDPISGVE